LRLWATPATRANSSHVRLKVNLAHTRAVKADRPAWHRHRRLGSRRRRVELAGRRRLGERERCVGRRFVLERRGGRDKPLRECAQRSVVRRRLLRQLRDAARLEQTAIVRGDNTLAPRVEFLEKPELVRPGDLITTSGDGKVFPAGLLVGQAVSDRNGTLRVRLSADFERLEFLRVLRHHGIPPVADIGDVVGPQLPPISATEDQR